MFSKKLSRVLMSGGLCSTPVIACLLSVSSMSTKIDSKLPSIKIL